VADTLNDVIAELALANRILANEGVLDAFGHVSARHPRDPKRYLLSRSRSPLLIEPDDILEYTLDSVPVKQPKVHLYAERVIHGCIYQARADVMAVCHHHAPAIMPFAIAGVPIVPVFHLGAAMGEEAPFWDQHDEFGDTNLLVVKPEEGRSLARALGTHSVVMMNRHGATVVGGGLKELVSRSIFMCQNAESWRDQARRRAQPHADGGDANLGILERPGCSAWRRGQVKTRRQDRACYVAPAPQGGQQAMTRALAGWWI
jgi:ribulose-5-phosphate 4-epimerase/fuculose-1-phosphate aldolase